jgi:hypothetical protein
MPCSCKKQEIEVQIKTFVTLSFMFFSASSYAQQTVSPTENSGWEAEIKEIRDPDSIGISYLSWNDMLVWVEPSDQLQYTVLKGHLGAPINQLTLNGKNIYVDRSGDFEIRFGFRGTEKTFRMTALDHNNRVSRATFRLAPSIEEIKLQKLDRIETRNYSIKKVRYSLGAGYTQIHYEQTGLEAIDEHAVTIKGALIYRLVPNQWDLGLSSFANAFLIKSSSTLSVRYVGVNLKAGYYVLKAPSRFRIVLNGGLYYNTSFGDVGFSGMYGPQIFPELSYQISDRRSIMTYVKFSPVLVGSKIDFSKNRELAVGAHYSFPFARTRRLSIGVDYSRLDLFVDGDSASTSTLSLSTSLSF